MKIINNYCSLIVLVLTTFTTSAQTTFPSGTNLCESSPWKLVFFDEFNGYIDSFGTLQSGLNPLAWRVYPDTVPCNYSCRTYYDVNNVSVSGGICTISAKHQPTTVGGDTRNFTAGKIEGAYTNYFKQHYHKGKFEARISYPSMNFVHSNFELNGIAFTSDTYPNPDISVAEAYGGPRNVSLRYRRDSYRQKIEFLAGNNEFIGGVLVSHHTTANLSPRSEMLNLFDNYHIYGFEWDENYVTWTVDGVVKKKRSRYNYVLGMDLASCFPEVGIVYNEADWFPNRLASFSNLRRVVPQLECFLDNTASGREVYGDVPIGTTIASVKVDWVRIYQRSLDTPTQHDLCDRNISGVSTICDNLDHTFSIIGDGAGLLGRAVSWNWAVSPNLTIVSYTHSTITVRVNASSLSTGSSAWVKYIDDNPICPQVIKYLSVGTTIPPKPEVCLSTSYRRSGGGDCYKSTFTITNAVGATTYNWRIKRGSSSSSPVTSYTGWEVEIEQCTSGGAIQPLTVMSVTGTSACGTSLNGRVSPFFCGAHIVRPPVIYPTDVCASAPVEYHADFSFYPSASFQWYRSIDSGLTFSLISGETNPSYLSSNPNASEKVFYTVVDSTYDTLHYDTSQVTQIAIVPYPTLNASISNDTISSGDTVILMASSIDSQVTFRWEGGTLFCLDSTCESALDVPIGPTIYTVNVTNGAGCVSQQQKSVFVFSAPQFSISADSTHICKGDTVTIFIDSPEIGVNYSWSGGNFSCANSNCSVVIDMPEVQTEYTVTATSVYGGRSTKFIVIDVDAPEVDIQPDYREICSQSVIHLSVYSPLQSVSYLWTGGNIECSDSLCIYALDTLQSDSAVYSVIATDASGCTNFANLTVNKEMPITIDASETTLCSGETLLLSVQDADNFFSYSWNGGSITCGDTFCFSAFDEPIITTTYSVTATDYDGCNSTSSIQVIVNEHTPSFVASDYTSICAGDTVSLWVIAPDSRYLYWWTGGAECSFLSTFACDKAIATPTTSTLFTVHSIDTNLCEDVTPFFVEVDDCPDPKMDKSEHKSDFEFVQVFPNPNEGDLQIKGRIDNVDQPVKIEIINMIGQIIFADSILVENYAISFNLRLKDEIPNGVYFIHLQASHKEYNVRFVLSR